MSDTTRRTNDNGEWRQDAAELNDELHRLAGVETCETACTPRLTDRWTLLGVANVAARNGAAPKRG